MQPPESVFEGVEVPAAVIEVAAGRPTRPVWKNVLGGLTYEISDTNARFFVKFAPEGSGLPLGREAERLAWAAKYTPVPKVVDSGADKTGVWLLTEALPGRSAVDTRWRQNPEKAVTAIAYGLSRLHQRLPVDECPFDWSAEDRLARIPKNTGPASTPPPIDKLVVCHGDPCAPNTLLDDDGNWSGNVDMAALGRADRWADLAVASLSLSWNYGPGWEPLFFDTYGIAADPERIAYYRLLWDLGS